MEQNVETSVTQQFYKGDWGDLHGLVCRGNRKIPVSGLLLKSLKKLENLFLFYVAPNQRMQAHHSLPFFVRAEINGSLNDRNARPRGRQQVWSFF